MDRCPCCGATMVVEAETQSKVTLRCPNCMTTELRIRQQWAGRVD